MIHIKKIVSLFAVTLVFSSSFARYQFAGIGRSSLGGHSSTYYSSSSGCSSSCGSCDRGAQITSPKTDAVVFGTISSFILGLGLYGYFNANSCIDKTEKITQDFCEIKDRLHALDVYDINYVTDAFAVIDKINEFNETYKSTIKEWYFCKSEFDIFWYGNMWVSEFMVELQDFEKSNQRLLTSEHSYALEDAKESLKTLKKLAGDFHEGCKEVVSSSQSGKFISKIMTGVGLVGLAASMCMYAHAGATV